ncbi:MAG: hemoglobin-like flavoprotein [Candidatus Omnitrophota bacterium]|jgi:hemoglobin-like flavoprotein
MQLDEIFNDSLERVQGTDSHAFYGQFYKKFIAQSPEIKAKFTDADMHRQEKMLHASLLYMMNLFSSRAIDEPLEHIATLHNAKKLNIEPRFYDIWLDTLVDTVKEFDPKFNDKIELAWRVVLAGGVAFMKFRYSKSL